MRKTLLVLSLFVWLIHCDREYNNPLDPLNPNSNAEYLPAPTGLKATAGYTWVELIWDSMPGAVKYQVYREGNKIAEPDTIYYKDTGLEGGGTYMYQVAAVHPSGLGGEKSESVSAITRVNRAPNIPSNPSPSDGDTDVTPPITLYWTGGDPDSGDIVKYDVYFGIKTSPPKVATNHSETSYTPPGTKYNTKYYWKIVAKDSSGDTVAGPIWNFTTSPQPQEMEIKYDDGKSEEAWLITDEDPREVGDDEFGWCMKMTPPSFPFTLTKVKFFFYEASYDFYLHVYKDEYGEPGRNLLHTPYRIDCTHVPSGYWWIHDVSSENVVIESGDFYVGFCYSYLDVQDRLSVTIGADESPPFDDRAWVNLGEGWSLFSGHGSEYRYDLMIRAVGYIGGVASPRREVEITGRSVKVYRSEKKIRARFMKRSGEWKK